MLVPERPAPITNTAGWPIAQILRPAGAEGKGIGAELQFAQISTKKRGSGAWKGRVPNGAPMNEPNWILAALERHERALIGFAQRITGDVESAREVVQETFTRLCAQRRDELEGRAAEWLYTTCRNLAIDHHRRGSARAKRMELQEMDHHADTTSATQALETKEESARVIAMLKRLPDKQREALELRFHGGLSYKQIASVTGDTIGNVGWLIHAGLKTLRERMSGDALRGRA